MKSLNEWKYAKKQSRLCFGLNGYYNEYLILVKDKQWHFWKVYAKSCLVEEINLIWYYRN